jgi:hypothetical protein
MFAAGVFDAHRTTVPGLPPPPLDCAEIVAIVVALAVAPALSVTVSVIVYEPLALYVCVAVGDELLAVDAPSPHVHAHPTIVPAGWLDPLPLTVSDAPAIAVYGPPGFAIGATVIGADAVSPDALYALTTIVCRPPENGTASAQPHVPDGESGVSL